MKLLHRPLLFVFLLLSCSLSLKAQYEEYESSVYRKWKVDGMIGYARPQGAGTKTGFLLNIEPKYNITDQITTGLRIEGAAMARGYVDVTGVRFNGEAGLNLSFVPTVDYYFTQTLARPFLGTGAGVYNLVSAEVNAGNTTTIQIPSVTKFGFLLRGGVEIWHIRTAIEYNFIGKTGNINNNYLGLKIGFVIGGGPRLQEEE